MENAFSLNFLRENGFLKFILKISFFFFWNKFELFYVDFKKYEKYSKNLYIIYEFIVSLRSISQ